MADVTSTYEQKQKVKTAKAALASAKKEKADKSTIDKLAKHLKTQETLLKKMEQALGN